MIQDKSNEFHDTWTFLNRRLVEAVQLHDLLSKSEVTSQTAKDTVQSVFVTVRWDLFANVIRNSFSLVYYFTYILTVQFI